MSKKYENLKNLKTSIFASSLFFKSSFPNLVPIKGAFLSKNIVFFGKSRIGSEVASNASSAPYGGASASYVERRWS